MRAVRRVQPNRGSKIETATVPAPVRGLNARDPLPAMKPTDALRLDNMLCRTGYLEVRKGRQSFSTGFTAPVETLMTYTSTSGTNKLFAAAGSGIFDATSGGAIGAAVVSGLTSAYWNYTQLSNTGGNYLICCNGQDNSKIYDGTTWANLSVTGLAITSISQVAVWKRRLWCVEKNSFNVWYLATDAIAGALTKFSFSGVFRRGGSVVAILNWTIDGGSGSDDHFLAVTSQGEVAVYRGTDPSSAADFALVGVYFVGPPVGTRFYAQLGGDVLLLTSEGLLALSKYLQSQTVDKTAALTDRIQQLISADVSSYGTTQGWEVHVFYDDNFVFLQVPAGSAGSRYQYVMSLITGAWSRFLVLPAITWCVQANTLYMGGTDTVYNAWTGGLDEADPIPFYVTPAFSYFKSATRQKKFNMGRQLYESDVAPRYRYQFLGDFNLQTNFAPLAPAPTSGNLWDVALWDASSFDSLTTYNRQWYALAGMAYAGTQAIFGISTGSATRLISIDYTYEVGGLL